MSNGERAATKRSVSFLPAHDASYIAQILPIVVCLSDVRPSVRLSQVGVL